MNLRINTRPATLLAQPPISYSRGLFGCFLYIRDRLNAVLVLVLFFVAVPVPPLFASPLVELIEVPNGGIQPQATLDDSGTIHLLYYKGDAKNGNLFYVKKGREDSDFSRPLQVNSLEGSATARASIAGGQIAVGSNGDVFVTWNASEAVRDRVWSSLLDLLTTTNHSKHNGIFSIYIFS